MRKNTITNDDTRATIVPERGGLITSFAVGSRDILFLDRATLEDRQQPVRGGIPILFPFAGRLDDKLLVATRTTMDLHGFARDLEWDVETHDVNSYRMALEVGPDTLANYPFPHRLTQTTTVTAGELYVTLDIENKSAEPMPVAPGWHPYFRCPGNHKTGVLYDLAEFPYDQLSNKTYDFGMEPPTASVVNFDIPNEGGISLSFSPSFRHLQFWTLPDRDFVCIEPWDGPANIINSAQRRLVPAGQTLSYWMRITPC